MPPPNSQDQVEIVDEVSYRWGWVVAGSAHLEGEDGEYRFRFRPDMTVEGSDAEIEIKGKAVKTAVEAFGPDTFNDDAEVTVVSRGGYSNEHTKWVEPGRGRPVSLPESV